MVQSIIGMAIGGLGFLILFWAIWSLIKKIPGTASVTTSQAGQAIEKAADYTQDIATTIALKGALMNSAIQADAQAVAEINRAITLIWTVAKPVA